MSHKPKLASLFYLTILCLFFCVICSHYSALASNIKTVELKMWEEYTDEEKEILQNRWTKERVDAVVKALKEGTRMPDFITEVDRGRGWLVYDLRGIQLQKHDLDSVDLSSTYLQGADLSETSLQGADLTYAKLQGANLTYAKLQGAYLEEANLQGANLTNAKLQDAELPLANLQGANLDWADLQGAYLSYANLRHAYLTGADLQGADLFRAKLQGADLTYAKLQGAYLNAADLQGADLFEADLQGATLKDAIIQHADLREANLEGAILSFAQLRGANLQAANLQDADLYRVRFDSTYLWRVNLEAAKNIRYIRWGDSLENRFVIGEEKWADSTKIDQDFRKAEITYRDLKALYKKQLMDEVVMEFHFRENEVRTKSYAWYQPGRVFRLLLLKWTYGYGSRPTWLLWYAAVVIGLFALIFAIFTIPRKTKSGIYLIKAEDTKKEELLPFHKGRLFLNCLYFSTLSFATFGYGAIKPQQWLQLFRLEPVEYKPVRWARIFVGIEAALGIWIFALLVTVLFGK